MTAGPTPAAVAAARERIAPHLARTPVHRLRDAETDRVVGGGEVQLKLELLQRTGSFKARGALNTLLTLSEDERRRGVVAVSAGNHAIAVAFAAQVVGVPATVVMHRAADPYRVAACRRHGAEVILADDIEGAFATMERLRDEVGRVSVHPFEGARTLEGTATVGAEIAEQVPGVELTIVAVGGGGLIAGIGAALRAAAPGCRVVGVEPAGAAGMAASFAAGRPMDAVEVDTIADSMGAPMHTAGTFEVCREVVDELVTVDDDEMCSAMAFAYDAAKLVLEPAGAASLAALLGPLRGRAADARTVAVLCGSNIGEETFARYLARGRRAAGAAEW